MNAEKRSERLNFILLTVLSAAATALGLLAKLIAIGPEEVRLITAIGFWIVAALMLGFAIRALYRWLS